MSSFLDIAPHLAREFRQGGESVDAATLKAALSKSKDERSEVERKVVLAGSLYVQLTINARKEAIAFSKKLRELKRRYVELVIVNDKLKRRQRR